MTVADDRVALINAAGILRSQARALAASAGYIFKEISQNANESGFARRADRESIATNAAQALYVFAGSIGKINDLLLPLFAARSSEVAVTRGPLLEPVAEYGKEFSRQMSERAAVSNNVQFPPGVANFADEKRKRKKLD